VIKYGEKIIRNINTSSINNEISRNSNKYVNGKRYNFNNCSMFRYLEVGTETANAHTTFQ
jgi:hypothetical protein